jgi:hypothetical protein
VTNGNPAEEQAKMHLSNKRHIRGKFTWRCERNRPGLKMLRERPVVRYATVRLLGKSVACELRLIGSPALASRSQAAAELLERSARRGHRMSADLILNDQELEPLLWHDSSLE